MAVRGSARQGLTIAPLVIRPLNAAKCGLTSILEYGITTDMEIYRPKATDRRKGPGVYIQVVGKHRITEDGKDRWTTRTEKTFTIYGTTATEAVERIQQALEAWENE